MRVKNFEEFEKNEIEKDFERAFPDKKDWWKSFKNLLVRMSNFGMKMEDITIKDSDAYRLSIRYKSTPESIAQMNEFKLELHRNKLEWRTFTDTVYNSMYYPNFNIEVKLEDKDKLLKIHNEFFNQIKIPAFENFEIKI